MSGEVGTFPPPGGGYGMHIYFISSLHYSWGDEFSANPIRHPSLPDYVVQVGDCVIRAETLYGSDGGSN